MPVRHEVVARTEKMTEGLGRRMGRRNAEYGVVLNVVRGIIFSMERHIKRFSGMERRFGGGDAADAR